jgi:hypothetical protein
MDNARVGLRAIRAGEIVCVVGDIPDHDGAVVLRGPFDDFEFVLDGWEGAKEEVAGVGHDGGAARRDASLSLVEQEAREEVVDGDSGLEFSKTAGEKSGEIDRVPAFGRGAAVVGAEGGRRVRNEHAAPALAGVLLAA